MTSVEVGGRTVSLTNLDRVLWPAAGFTKGRMIEYYRRVSSVLLPHLAGRPVMMWRFPEGVQGPNWFQNTCRGAPGWMRVAPLPDRSGGEQRFCVIDDEASLVWAANQGSIELHPLLATADEPERPTAVVFDLDPGEPAGVVDCARVALWIREVLQEPGLAAFPKTSGSTGLHVVVPLGGSERFSQAKRFARQVAGRLVEEHPDRVVDVLPVGARAGKVLIDWRQNDTRRSMVAPYSLRGMAWPTVSTPLTWDEVEAARGEEDLTFDADHVLGRIERHGDLHRRVLELEQRMDEESGRLLGRLDSNQD